MKKSFWQLWNEVTIPHYSIEKENIKILFNNIISNYLGQAHDENQYNKLQQNIKNAIKIGVEMTLENIELTLPLLQDNQQLYQLSRVCIILTKLYLKNKSVTEEQLQNASIDAHNAANHNIPNYQYHSLIAAANIVSGINNNENNEFNDAAYDIISAVYNSNTAVDSIQNNISSPYKINEVFDAIKYYLLHKPILQLNQPDYEYATILIRNICTRGNIQTKQEIEELLFFGQNEYGIEFFPTILNNTKGLTKLQLEKLNPYFEKKLSTEREQKDFADIIWKSSSLKLSLITLICSSLGHNI